MASIARRRGACAKASCIASSAMSAGCIGPTSDSTGSSAAMYIWPVLIGVSQPACMDHLRTLTSISHSLRSSVVNTRLMCARNTRWSDVSELSRNEMLSIATARNPTGRPSPFPAAPVHARRRTLCPRCRDTQTRAAFIIQRMTSPPKVCDMWFRLLGRHSSHISTFVCEVDTQDAASKVAALVEACMRRESRRCRGCARTSRSCATNASQSSAVCAISSPSSTVFAARSGGTLGRLPSVPRTVT